MFSHTSFHFEWNINVNWKTQLSHRFLPRNKWLSKQGNTFDARVLLWQMYIVVQQFNHSKFITLIIVWQTRTRLFICGRLHGTLNLHIKEHDRQPSFHIYIYIFLFGYCFGVERFISWSRYPQILLASWDLFAYHLVSYSLQYFIVAVVFPYRSLASNRVLYCLFVCIANTRVTYEHIVPILANSNDRKESTRNSRIETNAVNYYM